MLPQHTLTTPSPSTFHTHTSASFFIHRPPPLPTLDRTSVTRHIYLSYIDNYNHIRHIGAIGHIQRRHLYTHTHIHSKPIIDFNQSSLFKIPVRFAFCWTLIYLDGMDWHGHVYNFFRLWLWDGDGAKRAACGLDWTGLDGTH